jgi:hypothetical protein
MRNNPPTHRPSPQLPFLHVRTPASVCWVSQPSVVGGEPGAHHALQSGVSNIFSY